MAILSGSLTVWEIGFRSAGFDDKKWWFRIPLAVQDNFRNLMEAILSAELVCETISLEKPSRNPELMQEFSIYRYLQDVEACIAGRRFNRKLLQWALIDRYDFRTWCERRGIPLPEFWFPEGWKLEYELPEDELPPGYLYLRQHSPQQSEGMVADASGMSGVIADVGSSAETVAHEGEAANMQGGPGVPNSAVADAGAESQARLRASQRARIACQQIAQGIWRKDPERTIASVVKDALIREYGGGGYYADVTVREWVKVVAPPKVRQKRGRPPKENGAEDL